MRQMIVFHRDVTITLTQFIVDKYKVKIQLNIYLSMQCLSQDLETGCLKLAVVKFLGVQIFKEDHNILIFQP